MTARRLQLAFFSPFSPQKSGIADYSEELLPYLGAVADVDLITGPQKLSNKLLLTRFRTRSVPDFLRHHADYDAAIYQIGNNLDHHGYIVPCMRAVPGILVLHDICLQYLMLGLTVNAGNFRALVDTLRPAYGPKATLLATKLLFNCADPNRISFARPLIDMSSGIIVHSRYANDLVSAQVPNKYIRVVPMGVPLDGPQTPSHVLASRYGLQPKDFVLASISTLAMTKRLDVALCVVHRLRPEMPHLKFLVVGGGNLADEARNMIRRYGLKDSVVSTGWVTSSDYRGLIALADIVLDLRYPSGAETSASITRAMAVGRPLIVSAQGSFLELPDGCSIKIPVGPGEVARICGAVQQLATDPVLRGSMGRFARAYSESNFRLEQAARAYVEFAAEIARSPKAHRNLVPWPAVDARSPAAGLVSAIYKLTRIAYLYRNYGWSDTLRRVREEIRLRNLSEPEGT